MKIVSLALASGLAVIAASAQTAIAQTQDQTGAATVDRSQPSDNGSATSGSGHADRRGDWRRDDDKDSTVGRADEKESNRRWNDRGPTVMGMRPMMPHRRMMLRGQAAHFHFARGNARIDVTCSVQEDTEACVRAAGTLIDKIAELHRGGRDRDNMNGSAGGGDERSGNDEGAEQGSPGERM